MTLENGYLLKGRYRILDILGQGSMGVVYRAVDEKMDFSVVIKESQYISERVTRQFREEAKVLASLRHPNLSRVLDYFVIEGQAQYLVMEHIEGGNLQQWMAREEGLTEMEALQIGIAVCNALIYLHSQEPAIIHRGIKPENIKFTPYGEIILVDLGFLDVSQEDDVTAPTTRRSKWDFSPPEQYGEEAPDHRSDIFSLGATLYTALAGYLIEDCLSRATGKISLSSLRSYLPHLSRLTVVAIEKALNLRLEDRWQSAQAFRDALVKARDALPAETRDRTRLATLDALPPVNRTEPQTITGTRKNSLIDRIKNSKYIRQRDPVWFIYAAVIILLVAVLGVALYRPQGLRSIFSQGLLNPEVFIKDEDPNAFEGLLAANQEDDSPAIGVSRPTTDQVSPISTQPSPTPAPTPTGGGGGLIAYVSESSGIPQIWLVDVTSKATTQLTDLEDGACQPDWSPTGEQIVFTSPCTAKRASYPGSRLVIIDVDDGELTSLPPSLEGDFDPAWSPDGEWIAYTTLINGRPQLVKIHLGERAIVRLSDGTFHDSSPAWSPDGEQLAFTRIRGASQIWLMNADGEDPVQFTRSGNIDNSNPVWFTDGTMILFSQSLGLGSPSKQLYGMRLDDIGKPEEYPIIPRIRLDYIPLMDHVDVSPDGFWLAFDYWYFDVLSDIYMMSFPGANLIQLTNDPGFDYDPVWSPLP